jgi:hypothetical protein
MSERPIGKEKRAYPRIVAPATAHLLRGEERLEYPVRDISRSGVFLFTSELPAPLGEPVEVELGLDDAGTPLRLPAEVVRSVAVEGAEGALLGVGLEFVGLTEAQVAGLSELLTRIALGRGGQRRAYPRIACRLEVWCTTQQRRRCLVKDLSRGGAGLWLEDTPELGQPIHLELVATGGQMLQVEGRVVSAESPAPGQPYARIGVKFTPLSSEQRDELDRFLLTLL